MREALTTWGMGAPDLSSQHERLKQYDRMEEELMPSIGTARYDGMPSSGKISDTTASIALTMDKTRKALKREYDQARLEIKLYITRTLEAYNTTDEKIRKLPCQLKQLIIEIYRDKKEIKQIADSKRYSVKHIQRQERQAIDILRGE